jgi:zinc protease
MKSKLFVIISFLFIISINVSGQNTNQLPQDAAVRYGKLNNGLTYYIRHNEEPKQRAEFYIAQKVGSILEAPGQEGLAHFLEHMCFNGTLNFPDNTLIKSLEQKGIKFGANLNAYTSFDETVYNLSNIPVSRMGIIDTALLVLHDWSGYISLNDKDIDDERGVIREEWRTRNDESYRNTVTIINTVLAGTQYADRIPIGHLDVINNFPYQAIKDYYKKWYRPDLQAIIIVGDIDVDLIEAKIKQLFGNIPAPVNAAMRTEFQIPDNTEPLVAIASDAETQSTSISISYKRNTYPAQLKNTVAYYNQLIYNMMIPSMYNERLYDLSQQPNPPFDGANGSLGKFLIVKNKDAFSVNVSPRNNNDALTAFKAILIENERLRRYGFTAAEFERAKANLWRNYESIYAEKSKRDNGNYVSEYVAHFTDNEPYPGIEWEYQYTKDFLANLKLSEINQYAQSLVTDTNVVFMVTGPKNDSVTLPTKQQLIDVWNEARATAVEPNADNLLNKPLLDKKPKPGKIVKTQPQAFGYTQWTLSNGVKVMVKHTDLKNDEVVLSAYSPGGISLIDNNDMPTARVMSAIVPMGGVGEFSQVELSKLLAGKMASVYPSVGDFDESLNGGSSVKDFETMLQLVYLYFTQPRTDTSAFNLWKSQMKEQLKNASLDPSSSLSDTLNRLLTNNNERSKVFNLSMLEKVDYAHAIELYKARFANAADFTFFITGNIQLDSIKAYVETYLGSLPATRNREKLIDRGVYPTKGHVKSHFQRELSTPKSSVYSIYTGNIPCTTNNVVLINYIQDILNIVFTETIREKEGGTYGVNVEGNISKFPKERFSFVIQFDTDPTKREQLLAIVYNEIERLTTQGPSQENVNKVKEYMLKSFQEQTEENSYWSSAINLLSYYNLDIYTNYQNLVSSVTPEQIKQFAQQIFSQGNVIEVSMNPLIK